MEHGHLFQDPIERLEYYISHREERERQILEAMQSGSVKMSPMDIVKAVYTVRRITTGLLWHE